MSVLDFLRGAYCPLIVPFRDGKIAHVWRYDSPDEIPATGS